MREIGSIAMVYTGCQGEFMHDIITVNGKGRLWTEYMGVIEEVRGKEVEGREG